MVCSIEMVITMLYQKDDGRVTFKIYLCRMNMRRRNWKHKNMKGIQVCAHNWEAQTKLRWVVQKVAPELKRDLCAMWMKIVMDRTIMG